MSKNKNDRLFTEIKEYLEENLPPELITDMVINIVGFALGVEILSYIARNESANNTEVIVAAVIGIIMSVATYHKEKYLKSLKSPDTIPNSPFSNNDASLFQDDETR